MGLKRKILAKSSFINCWAKAKRRHPHRNTTGPLIISIEMKKWGSSIATQGCFNSHQDDWSKLIREEILGIHGEVGKQQIPGPTNF